MFRAPHCLHHSLSNEGNNRCENHASVNEKFVLGLFGAIRRLCRQEDKRGTRGEEDGGLELREPDKRRGETG